MLQKSKCAAWDIEIEKRTRRRKRILKEHAVDAGLISRRKNSACLKSVIGHLQHETSIRLLRVKNFGTKFEFLLNMKTLLSRIDTKTLRESCTNFGFFYDTGVHSEEFITESEECKMLLRT